MGGYRVVANLYQNQYIGRELTAPDTNCIVKSLSVCDRIGNSGRNRNRIAMIWPEPEPEPDCHPKKVAGFDRIGRI